MATSLTSNNLTLNHGSIVDVYNDRSAVLLISLNRSYTGTIGGTSGWSTGSNLTLSGSIGTIVTGVAWYRTSNGSCKYSVSASSGYWIMKYQQYTNSTSKSTTYSITTSIDYVSPRSESVSAGVSKSFTGTYSESSYFISGVAVIAIRVA